MRLHEGSLVPHDSIQINPQESASDSDLNVVKTVSITNGETGKNSTPMLGWWQWLVNSHVYILKKTGLQPHQRSSCIFSYLMEGTGRIEYKFTFLGINFCFLKFTHTYSPYHSI